MTLTAHSASVLVSVGAGRPGAHTQAAQKPVSGTAAPPPRSPRSWPCCCPCSGGSLGRRSTESESWRYGQGVPDPAPPRGPRKRPACCAVLQLATRRSMCGGLRRAGAPRPHKRRAGVPAGLLLTAKARRPGLLLVSGASIAHPPRPASPLAPSSCIGPLPTRW